MHCQSQREYHSLDAALNVTSLPSLQIHVHLACCTAREAGQQSAGYVTSKEHAFPHHYVPAYVCLLLQEHKQKQKTEESSDLVGLGPRWHACW